MSLKVGQTINVEQDFSPFGGGLRKASWIPQESASVGMLELIRNLSWGQSFAKQTLYFNTMMNSPVGVYGNLGTYDVQQDEVYFPLAHEEFEGWSAGFFICNNYYEEVHGKPIGETFRLRERSEKAIATALNRYLGYPILLYDDEWYRNNPPVTQGYYLEAFDVRRYIKWVNEDLATAGTWVSSALVRIAVTLGPTEAPRGVAGYDGAKPIFRNDVIRAGHSGYATWRTAWEAATQDQGAPTIPDSEPTIATQTDYDWMSSVRFQTRGDGADSETVSVWKPTTKTYYGKRFDYTITQPSTPATVPDNVIVRDPSYTVENGTLFIDSIQITTDAPQGTESGVAETFVPNSLGPAVETISGILTGMRIDPHNIRAPFTFDGRLYILIHAQTLSNEDVGTFVVFQRVVDYESGFDSPVFGSLFTSVGGGGSVGPGAESLNNLIRRYGPGRFRTKLPPGQY